MKLGGNSIAALALAGGAIAIGAARGTLSPSRVASTSGTTAFLVGAVAALGLGLAGVGWRFEARGRARELPAIAQRLLVLVALAVIALGALGEHAAARILELPAKLAAPSPSQYCKEPATAEVAKPEAPKPPPLEQSGCALVKRAYQLGYAKSLGACAPKQIEAPKPTISAAVEVCTKRRLDEPYLHHAYRRLVDVLGGIRPIDAAARRIADTRERLALADDLLASIRHALTGSPHAAHHVWISLPDPHPTTLRERFVGTPRCSTRFSDLPLWPRWQGGDEARVVEHVLGQLLFASRFGTTASCNDYVLHWDAPADACARLARDAEAFLRDEGALGSVRAVLDRRRRDLALGRSAPPAAALVSFACFATDRAAAPSGRAIDVDGEPLALRDVHVAGVRVRDDGPIDVYLALAALLAGGDVPATRAAPEPIDVASFVALDRLLELDPFAGARWPLARAELVDVFPFEHHLHAFVDAFRRRYLPQRGRL